MQRKVTQLFGRLCTILQRDWVTGERKHLGEEEVNNEWVLILDQTPDETGPIVMLQGDETGMPCDTVCNIIMITCKFLSLQKVPWLFLYLICQIYIGHYKNSAQVGEPSYPRARSGNEITNKDKSSRKKEKGLSQSVGSCCFYPLVQVFWEQSLNHKSKKVWTVTPHSHHLMLYWQQMLNK